jgi:hypothetical protein
MLGCLRRIEGKEKVSKLERTEKKSFFLEGRIDVFKQVIGENLYTSFEQYKNSIKYQGIALSEGKKSGKLLYLIYD